MRNLTMSYFENTVCVKNYQKEAAMIDNTTN